MDRWTGVLKVPVCRKATDHCRVAASLCISPSTRNLIVPKANAILFIGDRAEGTGNSVIDKLSDLQNLVKVIVSKLGASANAWVIEAPTFNGPFAVYKQFIQSLNKWGEPQAYKPNGFPASTSIISLLSNFCSEADLSIHLESYDQDVTSTSFCFPQTLILGFSKGGVVLNQLVTELGLMNAKNTEDASQPRSSIVPVNHIIPSSTESFLESINEIHYVDVGLNTPGAYLTDDIAIERIVEGLVRRDKRTRFVLHGTPRQWNDKQRPWICEEKNKFHQLLESGGQKSGGRLEVSQKTYFNDRCPDLQMHFQIIEKMMVA